MPKNAVTDWSTTASENTDVGGNNIGEGCSAAGINNAIREMMAQIANAGFQTSTQIATTLTDYQLILAEGAFVDGDKTKLDGIEALADVTDATNVDAAGAVMNTDASTAAMSFVIDEDNMASNSATKVPTQQSVKAYVDAASVGSIVLVAGAGFTLSSSTGVNDFDTTSTSYVDVPGDITFASNVSGTVTVRYVLKTSNASYTASAQLYVDAALVDSRTTTSTSGEVKTFDATITGGSVITFKLKTSFGIGTAYISTVSISSSYFPSLLV